MKWAVTSQSENHARRDHIRIRFSGITRRRDSLPSVCLTIFQFAEQRLENVGHRILLLLVGRFAGRSVFSPVRYCNRQPTIKLDAKLA